MEKITIVINGVGGCGKDTLCDMASEVFSVRNRSSITPIKEIAKRCGWNGEKTDKARKFLSDMKKLLTEYNEYPLNYLLKEQKEFIESDEQIMFVHIREPEEISKFMRNSKTTTYALLINPREELKDKVYGNKSDDEVANYNYDFIFDNDKPLEITKQMWIDFLKNEVLAKEKAQD